jgi:hypothetical protein
MLTKDVDDRIVRNGIYPRNKLTFNLKDRVNSKGQILELNSTKDVHGERMFVIDKDGNVFIGKRDPSGETRMPHPTLLGGKNPEVQAAGKKLIKLKLIRKLIRHPVRRAKSARDWR